METPKYTVLKDFVDLQDNRHSYHAGDSFPRVGVGVSEERVAELASTRNKCRVPLIAEVKTDQEVKEKPKKKRTSKNAGANS